MFRLKLMLLTCLLSITFFAAETLAQKTMNIQVREAQLRAAPSHLAKTVARVTYGERVTVLEDRDGWRRVSVGAGQGWLHTSALTTKRVALKARQDATAGSVGQDEIVLAGKGFGKEVEAEYIKANKNLDYAWINKMETFKIYSEDISAFIASGRLNPVSDGGLR